MKRTIYILGILLTGIVGSILVWFLGCCNCNKTQCSAKKSDQIALVQESPTSYPFSIEDANGHLDYETQDNFNFYNGKDQIILPVSSGVDTGVEKIKNYLLNDEKKMLDIIGLYTSNEVNDSPFPDLGISRANAVKNYLVAKGIDSKNINLSSKLDDDMVAQNTIYQGPISYYLHTLSDAEVLAREKELNAIHDHIVHDPLVLHFDFGSKKIKFSNAQRNKLNEIVTYIDSKHNATLDVIGHTDNVGDATNNTALGLERANFIKDYLRGIGIDGHQIKTISKGPHQPITTNDTAEGRAENRRVEIILE